MTPEQWGQMIADHIREELRRTIEHMASAGVWTPAFTQDVLKAAHERIANDL